MLKRNLMKTPAILLHFFNACSTIALALSVISAQAQSEIASINDSGGVYLENLSSLGITNAEKEDVSAMNVYTSMPYMASTARFVNVDEYVRKNVQYPDGARKRGASGKVKVQFDILTDASLDNIKVIDAPSEAFAAEAIRLVREMPRWEPATKNYQPVKTRYQLNLNFSLR